jgi:hypothetical protein
MFATLSETLSLAPDVRLGQLIAHLGFLGEEHLDRGLNDLEDDELLAIFYRHRAELIARAQSAPATIPPTPSATVSISGSATMPSSPAADVSP